MTTEEIDKKTTYRDKLLDKRWQQRRLDMLQKSKWLCSLCGCDDNTLHVHHIEYVGDPWEAEDHQLIVLCEKCHNAAHSKDKKVKQMFDCAMWQRNQCKLISDHIKATEENINQSDAAEIAALMRNEGINVIHATLKELRDAFGESTRREIDIDDGKSGTVISYGIIKRTFKKGVLTWSLIDKESI